MTMELVTNVGFVGVDDNDMRDDRRPVAAKQLIVVESQQQPRRFRHEASAVRVLYQTGVSTFFLTVASTR
jgi:carbamoylphosphate synthase small subunit